MKPVLFTFGPLKIYSFGLMVMLGVLLSLFLIQRRTRKDGFPQTEQAFDLVFVTILAGFLGGRLLYVIQYWHWYAEHPHQVFSIWEGGLIFYGGVIAAFTALILFLKFKRIPVLDGLDFLVPYVALTHAFGRIGCFLNGCCYGRVCELPWGIRFPGLPESVHPTQLYEAFSLFLLFFFLNAAYGRKRFSGQVTCFYLMLYGLARFVLEFFRADNPTFLQWTYNQWISVMLMVSGAVLYVTARRRVVAG